MDAEQSQIRELSRRIAERLESDRRHDSHDAIDAKPRDASSVEAVANEVAALRERLAEVNRRLASLQSARAQDDGNGDAHNAYRRVSSATSLSESSAVATKQDIRAPLSIGSSGTYVSAVHPSEQRFEIGEAVAELVSYFEGEKTCDLEPGGRPCDHCAMCSTRGF